MEFKENKKNGLYVDDEYHGSRTEQKPVLSVIFCFALALAFLWFTKSLWSDFTALENGYKDLKVHSLIYLLYQIGGKWLACGFFGVCATVFIFQGFKSLIKIKNKEYTS